MDLIALQRSDHGRLERLMRTFAAEPFESRGPVFHELMDLLAAHAYAEEEVLFPAARRVLPDHAPATVDIERRHHRIADLLLEMEQLDPGEPRFMECTRELFPLLRTDMRQEEDELLPRLAVTLQAHELAQLGVQWTLAKARMHTAQAPHRGGWAALRDRVRALVAAVRSAHP